MNKVPAHGQTVSGIDVSHYQPGFNFVAAKAAGHQFCFIKATEGAHSIDNLFHSHHKAAKAAGMLVGAYHFFHPSADPIEQARHFASVVGALAADELPCAMDWESTDGVPSDSDRNAGRIFLEEVRLLTKKNPIVYTGPYFGLALSLDAQFASYPLWVAHYGTSAPLVPAPWKVWSFWQKSGKGVDEDVFNGSIDQLHQMTAGL